MNNMLLSKRCQNDGIPLVKGLTATQITCKEKIRSLFEKGMICKVDCCPLCGSNKDRSIIAEKDKHGLPCKIVVCDACGMVFQSSPLNNNALRINYEKYSMLFKKGEIYKDRNEKIRLFDFRVKRFAQSRYKLIKKSIKLGDSDLIVEMGCNDGANLYPFYLNGHNVIGFDIDSQSLEIGKAKNMDLRAEDMFQGLNKKGLKPKMIILSHYLEHVDNPKELLRKIWEILHDDGFLFVEVPGYKSWVKVRTGALHYFWYEHLLYFESTLKQLADICRFENIYIDENVTSIFSKAKVGLKKIEKVQSYNYFKEKEVRYLKSFKSKLDKVRAFLKN